MADTAASLAAASGALADLAAALGTQAQRAGAVIGVGRDQLGAISDAWGGSRADTVVGGGYDYLDKIAPVVDALTSAQSTVQRWSASAQSYADSMARHEQTLASLGDGIPIDDPDGWMRRHGAARSAMSGLRADWLRSCASFADELSDATTSLLDAGLATFDKYDTRATSPNVYVPTIAELASVAGVDVSIVDDTGDLEKRIAEQAAFLGSEDGALLFLIMETANQGDTGKADGNFSEDDMLASTDPAVVRALLLQAAEDEGFEFESGELDAMVAQVVGTAWMMRASPDEAWEDVDDDIEWHEQGVFRFVREELFAPASMLLVGGLCYGAAGLSAAPTGGTSLAAAGYCGGLSLATYRAADTWAHGGDAGEVYDSFTDLRTWGEGVAGGIVLQGATNFLLRGAPPVFRPVQGPLTQSAVTRGSNGLFGGNATPLTTRTGGGFVAEAGGPVQVFQTELPGAGSGAARFFIQETGVVPTSTVQTVTTNGLRYTIRPSSHGAVTVEVFDVAAGTVEKIRFVRPPSQMP